MKALPESGAEAMTFRAWEINLMRQMGLSEEQYGAIPVRLRVRFICAEKYDQWMQALAEHEAIEEMKRKSQSKGKP